jgi:NADP-dependent 3-hydroxy acid dehydrogenase YdfG
MSALAARLALVTGASAGIGAATARALAAAGARVVAAARRGERLEALAAEGPGAGIEPLVLDVRDAGAVRELLAARPFDLVVANAGLAYGVASVQEGEPADWQAMFDTNVLGTLHVLRAALPGMIARGRGDAVLLGAGRQVYAGGTVYCATKWALRAVYEGLRLDAAGKGVRVTTVDPGMVETDFSLVRFRGDAQRAAAVYRGLTPLQPEDVAQAVLWAVTRPPHVNIGEIVMWPTDQASTTVVRRTPDETRR